MTEYAWLPSETGIDVRFAVGLDGLSLWMYGLSALLMVSSVLVSWKAIDEQSPAVLQHAAVAGVGMSGRVRRP